VQRDRYLAERHLRGPRRLRSERNAVLQHLWDGVLHGELCVGRLLMRFDARMHAERDSVLGQRRADLQRVWAVGQRLSVRVGPDVLRRELR
jgi:hypothetical protein